MFPQALRTHAAFRSFFTPPGNILSCASPAPHGKYRAYRKTEHARAKESFSLPGLMGEKEPFWPMNCSGCSAASHLFDRVMREHACR